MSSAIFGICWLWMEMLMLLWLSGFAVVALSSRHWPLSSLPKMFHCCCEGSLWCMCTELYVTCEMWPLSLSLCHGHFPGESGLAGVYWSKGWWRWWCWWLQLDYWSYKSCKAPFKSSLPTNQHPVFLQAGCPWSLKRKNELALHRIEMRMIRWCGVKIIDKLSCTELRQQAVRNSWHKVVQRNSFWWWRLGENVLFWKLIWESQTKT